MTSKGEGLRNKYRVYKWAKCREVPTCNQEHLGLVTHQVFVLNPGSDPIAKIALKAYAEEAAARGYEPLAEDLFNWIAEI